MYAKSAHSISPVSRLLALEHHCLSLVGGWAQRGATSQPSFLQACYGAYLHYYNIFLDKSVDLAAFCMIASLCCGADRPRVGTFLPRSVSISASFTKHIHDRIQDCVHGCFFDHCQIQCSPRSSEDLSHQLFQVLHLLMLFPVELPAEA